MTQLSKKWKLPHILILLVCVTTAVVNGVMSYLSLQRMARIYDESIAMFRRSDALMRAHLAVHDGELILYEVVPMGSKLNPPQQDGVYTIHEVSDTGLGDDEEYYKTYNTALREVVDNPQSISWQIRLAVKAAKERGEWVEPKPAAIGEELPKSDEPPPRTSHRPLTTEEAFGPTPVEKK